MNEDVSPCKHPLTAPTPWGVRKLFCDKTLLHLIIITVTVSPVICAMQLDTCALPGPCEDLPLPHSREPKWTGPFVRALTWLVVPGRKGGEAQYNGGPGAQSTFKSPSWLCSPSSLMAHPGGGSSAQKVKESPHSGLLLHGCLLPMLTLSHQWQAQVTGTPPYMQPAAQRCLYG